MSNGNLDEEGYTRHKVKYSKHFVDHLPNKVVDINIILSYLQIGGPDIVVEI